MMCGLPQASHPSRMDPILSSEIRQMHCNIQILDSEENPWFIGKRDWPAEMVLQLAAERLPKAQELGLNKMQDAIPAFGSALAEVAKNNGSQDDIDKAVFELLMITCVIEQCMGIEAEVLTHRDFNFVIYDTGAVRYDRVEAHHA